MRSSCDSSILISNICTKLWVLGYLLLLHNMATLNETLILNNYESAESFALVFERKRFKITVCFIYMNKH